MTYYNLGIRRDTSADIADRWLNEVQRRLPTTEPNGVVFSFGTNDTTLEGGRLRVERQQSLDHLHQILSQARSRYPVLMISPAPTADDAQNDRTADLSLAFASIAQALQVPYLDVLTPLRQSLVWQNEARLNDGAHPRAAGYIDLAHLVQHWSAWLSWFS
jgi:lysophospholipase L1-like esterase